MSGREWKPGDVAMATVRGVPNVRIVRVEYPTTPSWMTLGEHPTGAAWHPEAHVTDARPLVVIDPEDREGAERLDAAIAAAYSDAPLGVDRATPMQAALRELATPTPPKPEEPTGLGAVVEDAEGERWVRKGNSSHGEDWTRQIGDAWTGGSWDRIAAVRVLSSGVQP